MTSPGPAMRTSVRLPSPREQHTFTYPLSMQASMPSVLPSPSAKSPFSKATGMWRSINSSTKSSGRFKWLRLVRKIANAASCCRVRLFFISKGTGPGAHPVGTSTPCGAFRCARPWAGSHRTLVIVRSYQQERRVLRETKEEEISPPLQVLCLARARTSSDAMPTARSGLVRLSSHGDGISIGGDEIGIGPAQAEYFVAGLPEHQLALSRTRKQVFDDLHMFCNPVWHRTEVGAKHHSVHTAHLNRGAQSNRVEPHAVDQDVGLEIVEGRPLVGVRPAGGRVADAVVIEVPIEFEASQDRRESAAHVDDQHLQLRVAIEYAGADHAGAVNGRVEGSANRLVEAVLHERLVPDRRHRWMDVHHEVIRFRKLPQPFRLRAVEEDAIGAVAVAGRNRNRLGAALVDHLLDDRPTALFERVCVGHQLELAGIAIPYLQVFVVQNLKGVVRADSKHVARKPFHLAAIAGKAESNAALAPLGHGVVQIEKFAIAD